MTADLGFRILLPFCLASALFASGQDLNLKVGYGLYDMGDMKKMQELFLSTVTTPSEVNESFSGYTFGIQYNYRLEENAHVGGMFEYKRVEGSVKSVTPSGEVYFNQKLANYSLAITTCFFMLQEDNYALPFYINFGGSYTSLHISQETIIRGRLSYEELPVVSTSFFIEPGIRYERQFSRLLLSLECGYEFNTNGSLHTQTNSNVKLVDNDGNAYATSWSGLRLRFGIGLRFDSLPETY